MPRIEQCFGAGIPSTSVSVKECEGWKSPSQCCTMTREMIASTISLRWSSVLLSMAQSPLRSLRPLLILRSRIQSSDADPQSDNTSQLAAALVDEQSQGSQIVFIDAGVANPADLIAGYPQSAEVVMLSADSDGIQQIADVLEGRSDIDAIHIISHGEAGEISLGDTSLTAATAEGVHQDALRTIGKALSETGDILIYGCDFGQDAEVLEALAEATGADVAASDDATGHKSVGGDWDLENQSGVIETSSISAELWEGLLGSNITVLDMDGNDDWNNPSRADITAINVDYSQVPSGTLTATLQLDAVSDSSGNVAGGLLFDTDGDGNANVLVLVTLEPIRQQAFSSFPIFRSTKANDSRPDKVAGKVTKTTPTTSTAVLSTTSNPYVAGDQDSVVTFTINLAELGGVPADTELLNAVTTASASPTSDIKDILLDPN